MSENMDQEQPGVMSYFQSWIGEEPGTDEQQLARWIEGLDESQRTKLLLFIQRVHNTGYERGHSSATLGADDYYHDETGI